MVPGAETGETPSRECMAPAGWQSGAFTEAFRLKSWVQNGTYIHTLIRAPNRVNVASTQEASALSDSRQIREKAAQSLTDSTRVYYGTLSSI
jgi:hypothetical protein